MWEWVEIIWKMMVMKMAANSVRWGGDREDDGDEDGGEQCEVGWR